jgi:hypothetical protein
VRLAKLRIRKISAQTKCERTKSITKPKCSRLLTMKWLPTAQAALTDSGVEEKRCEM